MTNYTATVENGTAHDQPTDAGNHQRVPIAGGVLVYEQRDLGKELVGFEDVTDWDAVADALAARGLARGHVHHLPELDDVEEGGA